MLIELSKTVCVDPTDVSAVEKNDRYDWEGNDFSGRSVWRGDGTCLTLKNGRKIYIPLKIDIVMNKLKCSTD
jgi:hypothetical protein